VPWGWDCKKRHLHTSFSLLKSWGQNVRILQFTAVQPETMVEHTGTCGVFDLMAEFGLSVDEALEVSDHLPVWAEFSVRESTVVGPVARRPMRSK